MSDQPHSGQRRAFYRLAYPEVDRPVLWVGNYRCAVVEISEMGARVLFASGGELPQSGPIAGAVQFADGEIVPVEGTVLRIEGSEAVLQLTVGISLRRMLAEQRRLLQLYPAMFDESGENPDPG